MPASINMYEVAEKLMELGDVDDPIYQSALAKLLNRPGRELHTRYPLRHPIPLKDKPISLVAPLKHDRNHNNNSSSTKGVDAKSETECLRSIVLSHLRLLEKQQAMVAEKEREIVELKRENLTVQRQFSLIYLS